MFTERRVTEAGKEKEMQQLIYDMQDQRDQLAIDIDVRQHNDLSELDSKLVDLKKIVADLQIEIPKVALFYLMIVMATHDWQRLGEIEQLQNQRDEKVQRITETDGKTARGTCNPRQ